MAATEKDTVYVDVDDEITSIIDKLRTSSGRIIALVLPKRASVFQSVVNMKLLKRAADSAKKRVVLITTEQNLMPLAGSVGLYVAATPQSKPEIPVVVPIHTADTVADDDEAYTLDNAAERPVGELTNADAVADEADVEDLAEDTMADEPLPRSRALAVPNFNRFRLRLFGLIALIPIIIAGLYVCAVVLPRATIAITTNTSHINVSLAMVLDTNAKILNTASGIVPAKTEQQEKTNSQQVAATGQKNTGETATGTITMSAQACAPHLGTPDSVPAGTGVSTNGLTFITGQTATFSFDHPNGGSCIIYKSPPITMTALSPGAKYNITTASFSVAGRTDIISATGSAGQASQSQAPGTDNFVKVVSQTDIDGAKQKLSAADAATVQAALTAALKQDGFYPLAATFNAGTPNVSTSANVGDAADNLTVTQATTYTMLGVQKTDLQTLITTAVSSQINTKDQAISDDGLATATIAVTDNTTPLKTSLTGVATVGPTIRPDDIKRQAKGKKIGDVKAFINTIPGVTSVDVRLSPFWVSTVPSDLTKVTVTIGKAS